MHKGSAGRIALIGLVMVLTVMVAVVTGCSNQPAAQPATDAQPMGTASQASGDAMPKMTCPMCNKGAPAVEKGTATDENGVQVVRITQKADFTQTGEATMDLGTLSPGTYDLTCGMDSAGGSLVVQ